jgi:hypothetical protein
LLLLFLSLVSGVHTSGQLKETDPKVLRYMESVLRAYDPTSNVTITPDNADWSVLGAQLADAFHKKFRAIHNRRLHETRMPTLRMAEQLRDEMDRRECGGGLAACVMVQYALHALIESMVFNLLHGVEHYFVYLDNRFGDDDVSLEALKPYVTVGVVTVIDWKGRIHVDAYNDCLRRFGSRFSWIAMVDDDEFIVAKRNGTLVCHMDLLREYEALPFVGGVVLRWAWFGSSGRILPDYASVAPDIFLYRIQTYRHIKTIVCSNRTIQMKSPHFALYRPPYSGVNVNLQVVGDAIDKNPTSYDKFYMAHYWSRSFEEYLSKISRGEQQDKAAVRTVMDFFVRDKQGTVLDTTLIHSLPPHLVVRDPFKKNHTISVLSP